MGKLIIDGQIVTETDSVAIAVDYDNTNSELDAINVQDAIDELAESVFTYVSNGKEQIASAITDKGIPTEADATFQTMADNISQISGSSDGAVLNISDREHIFANANKIKMKSDCLLASTISAENVDSNLDIDNVIFIDNTKFDVVLSDSLNESQQVKIKLLSDAYENKNGDSLDFNYTLGENSLEDFIGDTSLLTTYMEEFVDNDTYNQNFGEYMSFPFDGINLSSIGINSDGYIKFNGKNTILLNQRDMGLEYIGYCYNKINGMKFVKYRIEYNSFWSSHLRDFKVELYLFENGGVFIHILNAPSNAGTNRIDGIAINKASVYNSLYPTLSAGTNISLYPITFELSDMVYELYDTTKLNITYREENLIDVIGNYDNAQCSYVGSKKWDTDVLPMNFKQCDFLNFRVVNCHGDSNFILKNGNDNVVSMDPADCSGHEYRYDYFKFTDYNNLRGLRLIWGGHNSYNEEPYTRWWDVTFFENGDAMIYIKSFGSGGYRGKESRFCGVTYTPVAGQCFSFYKRGDTYECVNEIYDISKHQD